MEEANSCGLISGIISRNSHEAAEENYENSPFNIPGDQASHNIIGDDAI
jgi:hypothetical protein